MTSPTGDLASYGFVASVAAGNPEISALLNTASAEQWDPNRFQMAVQDTTWWKTVSPSLKQYQTMLQTDPAQLQQQIDRARDLVIQYTDEMGIGRQNVDFDTWALNTVKFGLNEYQLKRSLGSLFRGGRPDVTSGLAAQYEQKLKQLNQQYGVGLHQQDINYQISRLMTGEMTIDGYTNYYRNIAKHTYPGLTQEIDAGYTVQDVMAPYVQAMSDTLEIPATTITLQDPTIRKALMYKAPNGDVEQRMPLWDFERQLKDDPRWDRTKNASNAAYDMIAAIGNGMGFTAVGS